MTKYRLENSLTKNFKRIVVLSDLHCGHQLGLTPPSWQYDKTNTNYSNIAIRQKKAWNWYIDTIKMIGNKVDIIVVNGDAVEGKAKRNGGTELITTDVLLQCKIAEECINCWDADNKIIITGTEYHTGDDEQFENVIADNIGAKIYNQVDINVNGKILNFRHKVGNSGVPYGKSTAVIKEAIWNLIKKQYYHDVPADMVIRSHVHLFNMNLDSMRYSITTPALQLDSRYGAKQCSGYTDFGFIIIDIYDNGKIDVQPYLANIPEITEIIKY